MLGALACESNCVHGASVHAYLRKALDLLRRQELTANAATASALLARVSNGAALTFLPKRRIRFFALICSAAFALERAPTAPTTDDATTILGAYLGLLRLRLRRWGLRSVRHLRLRRRRGT